VLRDADEDVGGILDEGIGLDLDVTVERLGGPPQRILGADQELPFDLVEVLAAPLGGPGLRFPALPEVVGPYPTMIGLLIRRP